LTGIFRFSGIGAGTGESSLTGDTSSGAGDGLTSGSSRASISYSNQRKCINILARQELFCNNCSINSVEYHYLLICPKYYKLKDEKHSIIHCSLYIH